MFKLRLYQSVPYSCPYIPINSAQHHTTEPSAVLSSSLYSELINIGFRRAGNRIHRPNCLNCSQCVSLRIPVSDFRPNRGQRRVLAKNSNLSIDVVINPDYSQYLSLYETYINHRHPESESMKEVSATFEDFLFSPWSKTFSIEFRLPSEQLVCVAICDPLIQGWSAVYTFYAPDYSHLSLGTFSILKQIELLNLRGLEFLYLGYWINDCDKMSYKTQFKPCEGFTNDQWIALHE
ncbi:MAG: arginyltransferase [Gammaproteobacteria bacterium]